MSVRSPTGRNSPWMLAVILAVAPAGTSARAARTSYSTADMAAEAYVQGRLAVASGDYAAAAERFGTALKADDDAIARRRAFDVAMLAGDLKSASRLAAQIDLGARSEQATAVGDSILALARAAAAAAAKDWRAFDAARTAFDAPGRGGESGQVLGVLLNAWGKAARGDIDGALALADPDHGTGIAASYLREHRAHILSYGRRWQQAADAYQTLVTAEGAGVARLRLAAAGTALEAAPGDPKALEKAILLVGEGPERDPQLVEARRRLAADPRISGRKLADLVDSPQEGLALMFVRLAADLGRERATGAAVNFARLATLADPSLPDGWLLTSDLLARASREGLALDALKSLPKGQPWAELADARRVSILMAEGRLDEARAVLAPLLQRPDATVEDWGRLADLERRSERYPDAIAAYGRALALMPSGQEALQAQLLFLRGSARESAKDWAGAEADLRRAVELAPQNPLILNYLGYSLLDRGKSMPEARDLIARAYRISPENGAIVDSMGWAEHLLGNHEEAVGLLEQARSAEPGDPTVADHLGDALWKAGRRIEARHAWSAAAALSPEPVLAARIRRKLDYGLDVALAVQ